MGYYDDLVETHGDNDACKRKYKRGQLCLQLLLGIPLVVCMALNWFLYREQALCYVTFRVIAYGLIVLQLIDNTLKILIKPLDSIHVRPDLDDVDLGDGYLREREENGEDVFVVKYPKHLINGEYSHSRYYLSVVPKPRLFAKHEPAPAREYPAVTGEELPQVLAQAAEDVAALSREATPGH